MAPAGSCPGPARARLRQRPRPLRPATPRPASGPGGAAGQGRGPLPQPAARLHRSERWAHHRPRTPGRGPHRQHHPAAGGHRPDLPGSGLSRPALAATVRGWLGAVRADHGRPHRRGRAPSSAPQAVRAAGRANGVDHPGTDHPRRRALRVPDDRGQPVPAALDLRPHRPAGRQERPDRLPELVSAVVRAAHAVGWRAVTGAGDRGGVGPGAAAVSDDHRLPAAVRAALSGGGPGGAGRAWRQAVCAVRRGAAGAARRPAGDRGGAGCRAGRDGPAGRRPAHGHPAGGHALPGRGRARRPGRTGHARSGGKPPPRPDHHLSDRHPSPHRMGVWAVTRLRRSADRSTWHRVDLTEGLAMILVTGATGTVGRPLIELLAREGVNVRASPTTRRPLACPPGSRSPRATQPGPTRSPLCWRASPPCARPTPDPGLSERAPEMMISLDQGVTRLEYSVSYPYPASAVFAAITDFPAYPWWQPDVMGIRAAEALPAGPGTQVLEVDNVMGRQTHVTLTVTEYEQDRLITLQTPAGARPEVRQAYRLEPTGDGGCRLDFRLQLDDVPKMDQPLVKTQLSHQAKRFFEDLGAIVAVRPAGNPGGRTRKSRAIRKERRKMNASFDMIVIGAGPAGEKAAAQAAFYGKRVAVVDRAVSPGGSAV